MKTEIEATKNWIEKIVIGLNLCPFAKPVFKKNQIRYRVSLATTEAQLLEDFVMELNTLYTTSKAKIETSVLIMPNVLSDFEEYLDFLEIVEQVLADAELDGIIQVASFHPDYQFEDTEPDDIENYTNRSPYPIFHLLREESVEAARLNYPNVEAIPERNIETMKNLGKAQLIGLLK